MAASCPKDLSVHACEFRGADGLAYVALGVFGGVDQETDYRGRELFAAYGAGGG
jgi:hypothetical protein